MEDQLPDQLHITIAIRTGSKLAVAGLDRFASKTEATPDPFFTNWGIQQPCNHEKTRNDYSKHLKRGSHGSK